MYCNSAPPLLCHISERLVGYLWIGVVALCFPFSCQMHRDSPVLLKVLWIGTSELLLTDLWQICHLPRICLSPYVPFPSWLVLDLCLVMYPVNIYWVLNTCKMTPKVTLMEVQYHSLQVFQFDQTFSLGKI